MNRLWPLGSQRVCFALLRRFLQQCPSEPPAPPGSQSPGCFRPAQISDASPPSPDWRQIAPRWHRKLQDPQNCALDLAGHRSGRAGISVSSQGEGLPLCHAGYCHANVTVPEREVRNRRVRALAMSSRTRCLITAALACHLLVGPPLVTSQLLAAESAQNAPQNPPTAKGLKQEEVTITALDQENQGSMYKLSGNAKIEYGAYVLRADQITYNSDTGDATAEGHVMLDGGFNDEHIEANRGTYNIRSESGHFEHVRGSIGAHPRGNRLILSSSNPFFFSARILEKTAPDHYKVIDGTVTTCELPHPNWQFNAHKVVVDVGGTAKVYNTTFGLRGVPVLYLPFATVPAQRLPRQSGFLIPNIGTSSIKGEILGESFFWAINRSMDAHIGAEYFSKRGWAPQGEFRARPSERSYVDVNYFQVFDRGYGNPHVTQGGEEIRLTGEDDFGHNFRGVADVDYLSSFVFRLAFNEVFTQAVNSEVTSDAFLSNTSRGYFYNLFMQRYQDFESTIPGQVITILHAPSIDSNSLDQQIANTPFYWSYDAALEGLSRSEPGFSTAPLLARLDLNPEISMPLRLDGWSFRPSLSVR